MNKTDNKKRQASQHPLDRVVKCQDGEPCENCGKIVLGFEYKTCCSGYMCGCMGLPIEPCVCSTECYQKLYGT